MVQLKVASEGEEQGRRLEIHPEEEAKGTTIALYLKDSRNSVRDVIGRRVVALGLSTTREASR